jgi:hypothetical protein
MKYVMKSISVIGCLAFSISAFAAKPLSINFVADEKSKDGLEFSSYTVKCSDGNEESLTAWDQRKTWCVGKDSKDNCDKKQIRAAKVACKDSSSD